MKIAAGVIVGLLTSALAASEAELTSLVAQDLREPVRPGGVNGQAFWNMNALTFMYPPSFDLPKTEGADYYRFRVIGSDDKPVNSNRLHPCSVLDFMDAMYAATGDVRYRDCADRVFGFFERGPLQDWNWEGQFEDIPPVPFKYANMTMHPAGSVAVRICHRWPKDKKRIAQARDLCVVRGIVGTSIGAVSL